MLIALSLVSCGCISLINKPLRISKIVRFPYQSIYIHIYINLCDEQRINSARITIYDISDHLPVFINFNLHHPTQQKFKPNFRCIKHFDPNAFITDISLSLNNLSPEADDVTVGDEFVKMFKDTPATDAPFRYASRREQRSFNSFNIA